MAAAAPHPPGPAEQGPTIPSTLFFGEKPLFFGAARRLHPAGEKRERGGISIFLVSVCDSAFLLPGAAEIRVPAPTRCLLPGLGALRAGGRTGTSGSALGGARAGQEKGLTPGQTSQKIGGGGRRAKREARRGRAALPGPGTGGGGAAAPSAGPAALRLERCSRKRKQPQRGFCEERGGPGQRPGLRTAQFDGKETLGTEPQTSQPCRIPSPSLLSSAPAHPSAASAPSLGIFFSFSHFFSSSPLFPIAPSPAPNLHGAASSKSGGAVPDRRRKIVTFFFFSPLLIFLI